MGGQIEFYFDFMSPYAYLGSVGIERVADRHGLSVIWKPMLLGISVLKVMGLKPLPDTPLKADYIRRDVPRLAAYLGIPFCRARQDTMVSLPSARAFTWLFDQDPTLAKSFGQAVFRTQWAEGRDVSDVGALTNLVGSMGIEPTDLLAALESSAVKERLKQHVAASLNRGVFGAPTFIVGDEMFWGADRLPMIEHWIERGGW
jgi:2-hydroxychromene-2-carboxylate isomerase